MTPSLYPINFVRQKRARFGQHFRVHGRESACRVAPKQLISNVQRVRENENRVLAVRVEFAVSVGQLARSDQSACERGADGFEGFV